jgi:biotin synthase
MTRCLPPRGNDVSFTDRKSLVSALVAQGDEQEALFAVARSVRDRHFGPRCEVRSVIEYANLCDQECRFCGMWSRSGVARYVLSSAGFLSQVERLHRAGRRVIMVQTGQSSSRSHFDRLFDDLRRASSFWEGIVWIFAFGCLDMDHYRRLKSLGSQHRYLLKFEASRPELYAAVKPSDSLENRLGHLQQLVDLGFNVSTGNITGLPGQTLDDLVDDLLFMQSLEVGLVSTSPFVPNEQSAFSNRAAADLDTTLNVMALLRILCPNMLIPATSALEMVGADGQYRGLMAGANVVTLHDGTPSNQEEQFLLYRTGRYLPKEGLFDTIARANLEVSMAPLVPVVGP